MKRWSTEQTEQPGADAVSSVRSARFDRPLRHGATGSWGDAEVDRQVRAAIEEGRAQGRAAGYAAGWSQGRQAVAEQEQREARARAEADAAGRQQASARLQSVLAGLGQAAAELDRALEPAWEEVADAVTEGALRIAQAALGRELATRDAAVMEGVRTAVRAVAHPGQVTVRLHPQDHALLCGLVAQPSADTTGAQVPDGVRLIADPSLASGEVRAATPSQRLRLHLPSALAAAEEVLRG